MKGSRGPFLPLCIVLLAGAMGFSAVPEWPMPIRNWTPVQPGEHPRLFFRKSELSALRAKAATPEGKAIIARLRKLLNGSDGESLPNSLRPLDAPFGDGTPAIELPEGAYTMSHVAGFGLLYQLTGEKKYADLGKQCFELALQGYRDRDASGRYSFKLPSGALRAGPSLGWYAVGYDLCYDGWDEEYRKKIALELQNYNQGQYMSLGELTRGSRHSPGSNHWGMQVGGAALSLLAIKGDPGVNTRMIDSLPTISSNSMIRNMTEGFGDHGWFAEGDGTGSMSSQIAFIPALQAWQNAGGKDFITPRSNAQWMTLKWIFLTVPRGNGTMDFPMRGGYPQNVWDRAGLSGAGYFNEGFAGVTPEQRPALLWFYNRHLKARDQSAQTPFDTPSPYPHHAVLAFINFPFSMTERNPGEIIPKATRDEKWGFYMMRNRWQDTNDIVISFQTRDTKGLIEAPTDGGITIWALGLKTTWGKMKTTINYFRSYNDGSAILGGADETKLAIDFSKSSGADAMLVMVGPEAGTGTTVAAGGANFVFRFFTSGTVPVPSAQGSSVVVGTQTVRVENGNLVLGSHSGTPLKTEDHALQITLRRPASGEYDAFDLFGRPLNRLRQEPGRTYQEPRRVYLVRAAGSVSMQVHVK